MGKDRKIQAHLCTCGTPVLLLGLVTVSVEIEGILFKAIYKLTVIEISEGNI